MTRDYQVFGTRSYAATAKQIARLGRWAKSR
jgi:hypothetical protein